MIFTIAKEKVYIPAWNGNRDLPKAEQIKVTIAFPSAVEIQEIAEKYDFNSKVFEFLMYVKDVSNFYIPKKVGKRKATPEDIATQRGLVNLFTEIKAEYLKYITVDKKKLESD